MHGELHALREGPFVIEGQHQTSVWKKMNIPNIAMYRAASASTCQPRVARAFGYRTRIDLSSFLLGWWMEG
jgi:hypothetical protein